MQRCHIQFSVSGEINFIVQEGEEDSAEDIVERLEDGDIPVWLETLILESLMDEPLERLSIDHYRIKGRAPDPEEELNFDY